MALPQPETQKLIASGGTDIHGNSITPTGGFGLSVSISSNGAVIAIGGNATVGTTAAQPVVYLFP